MTFKTTADTNFYVIKFRKDLMLEYFDMEKTCIDNLTILIYYPVSQLTLTRNWTVHGLEFPLAFRRLPNMTHKRKHFARVYIPLSLPTALSLKLLVYLEIYSLKSITVNRSVPAIPSLSRRKWREINTLHQFVFTFRSKIVSTLFLPPSSSAQIAQWGARWISGQADPFRYPTLAITFF